MSAAAPSVRNPILPGFNPDRSILGVGDDAIILSDEASMRGQANFTGAFVGMACQDLAGTSMHADFDWFEYRERAYQVEPRTSGLLPATR